MAGKSERSPGAVVREIRRQTRRKLAALEKIRIVLEGLKGEASIAELCRREGISPNLYSRWNKDFLSAGKKRLQGDTVREANSQEVSGLCQENEQLKQVVAELMLKHRLLKKKYDWAELKRRRYMRYSQSEKLEIIRTVEVLSLGVKRTLRELGVNRSTFYQWYRRYQDGEYAKSGVVIAILGIHQRSNHDEIGYRYCRHQTSCSKYCLSLYFLKCLLDGEASVMTHYPKDHDLTTSSEPTAKYLVRILRLQRTIKFITDLRRTGITRIRRPSQAFLINVLSGQ